MAEHTFRNRLGTLIEIPEVTATQAKNTFGELLDRVSVSGPSRLPATTRQRPCCFPMRSSSP